MGFAGRPGLSPVTATLIATGAIATGDRILDVGCGDGYEAYLLARWGFRRVVGIDSDRKAVATARRRVARIPEARRPEFHVADARDLATLFPAASFDVVLDTLLVNNIRKGEARYVAGVAHVLRAGGTFVSIARTSRADDNAAPRRVGAPAGASKHFRSRGTVTTHLAEFRQRDRDPDWADVAVWIGTRR